MNKSACLNSAVVFMVTLFATLVLGPQSGLAQPGKSSAPDIEALQSQLLELERQIGSMKKSQSDSMDDSRVRSVGRRTQRISEPVVDDSLQIRLYDLSDLFAISPHYPAKLPNDIASGNRVFGTTTGQQLGSGGGGFGGGMGGSGGGGVFNVPVSAATKPASLASPKQAKAEMMNLQAAQVSMAQLVSAIKATVSPTQWGNSDSDARIQQLGNTLLITATEDMHLQINDLINLFREHWGKLRTVSIQTFWVRASSTLMQSLLVDREQASQGAGVVAKEKWDSFLAAAVADDRVAYSTTLTGHNNQTLYALSGTMRQLTLGAEPLYSTTLETNEDEDEIETTAVSGFQPQRFPILQGSVIQVTPLATRGGNFVILDLHAKINEEVGSSAVTPQKVFSVAAGEAAEVEIDEASFKTCRLSTTVRCPKDQVIMAGSMKSESSKDSAQPNLYLFVKVSVHTIEEDKSDWGKSNLENAKQKTGNSKPTDTSSKTNDETPPSKESKPKTKKDAPE